MAATLTLPGIGGSGERHWQTLWEAADPHLRRFHPSSWDKPELEDWSDALDTAMVSADGPFLVIAHSLSCLLVAHWAANKGAEAARQIRGAFLVAVPDPQAASFPVDDAQSFTAVPTTPLPFPCLIVASTNDPYSSLDYVARRAGQWGAGLVTIGAHGHINGDSGLGEWAFGRKLLAAFEAGIRPRQT